MRTFTKFLAVIAAVGLLAGGVQAVPFDWGNTGASPRLVQVDGEGLQNVTCLNLFNNPDMGLPVPPCNPFSVPAGAGCPNHPNMRPAGASCTTWSNSAPSATGPFFYPDPVGIASNDYWAVATHQGGTTWRFTAPIAVWGGVTQRTLGQSNATVQSVGVPMDMTVDFSATGFGSVNPVTNIGPPFGFVYYTGSALFGATNLGLTGIPTPADSPYAGQGQNPTIFASADAGVPLNFSCFHSANTTPPGFIMAPVAESVGGAATTTLTTTTPPGTSFAAYCTSPAVGLPACSFGTTARILSGADAGRYIDIIGQSATTLTLADPVNIAIGDLFVIEAYGSIGGAPFPQGPIYGAGGTNQLCSNAIGDAVGLIPELGNTSLPLPAGPTQLTAFVTAFTTAGTNPLTNPVWSPFDMRLEEVVDSDSDGIPDRHDNCVNVANGPLLTAPGAAGCYYEVDNLGNPVATGSPAAVGFVQVDDDVPGGDGNGNPCDGDFNGDGVVNPSDTATYIPDLGAGSSTPGSGTDMNCDGVVNPSDTTLYIPQLGSGAPGPSGLWCTGITTAYPCTF